MRKSDLRILIIEDDPTVGQAVEQALKHSGYTTQLATNYTQAIAAHEMHDFHGLVVDCMLPQKSGLDTATELIQNSNSEMAVVLTSGVYKDKYYTHDALMKTHARAFLQKPFDLMELVKHFDDAFSDLIDEDRSPLLQLFMRDMYSFRDKIQAINQTEFVNGFDLPFIYSLLCDPQITGELHIDYQNQKAETIIGFHRGRIDQVIYHDIDSYFGALLVEKGFATPEELQDGLSKQKKMPIGEFLVENSYISPHAIEIVQSEQMIIRLSKTIQDTSLKIKFIETSRPEPKIFIDNMMMPTLIYDWIQTKLSSEWLKTLYLPWLDHPLKKGTDFSKLSLLASVSSTKVLLKYLMKKKWDFTINEIITTSFERDFHILKGVHFFISQRVIILGSKYEKQENYDARQQRLEKILSSFQSKNYYEILGVSKNARTSEVQRSYYELAKTFHPDKLRQDAPDNVKALTQNIFSLITAAHQTLSTDQKRAEYKKTIELGQAEEILLAESSFDEAMKLLLANKFRESRKAFEKTKKMKGHRPDTNVYLIWALIKEKRHTSDRMGLAATVKEMMSLVPHEERHSTPFYFIKGMTYELTGQVEKAYEHFRHCEIIDPHFTHAKREISYIKKHYVDNQSRSFVDDIGTAVTKIFKRRAG